MRILVPFVVTLVAFMSCAPARYVYSPIRTTGAEISGATAASYDIPADVPRGRVELAVVGVAPIEGAGAGANRTSALAVHMVLVVSNASAEIWTIRPGEQRVELTHEEQLETVYPATAYSAAIEIAPGATRRVPLAFPLPAGVQNESEIPELSAVWVVRAGSRVIAQRTPFTRFRTVPIPPPRAQPPPGAR
jgi:hypothetical protein